MKKPILLRLKETSDGHNRFIDGAKGVELEELPTGVLVRRPTWENPRLYPWANVMFVEYAEDKKPAARGKGRPPKGAGDRQDDSPEEPKK